LQLPLPDYECKDMFTTVIWNRVVAKLKMPLMKRSQKALCCGVAALFAYLLLPGITIGQHTAPAPVCTDYPSVEVIFLGTLTDFTQSQPLSSMRFEALEPLTGENITSITVQREPGSLCRNPDPPVIGERYLVVAQGPYRNGEYSCSDLKRVADAGKDIEYFRLAESGLTAAEVSGEVRITGGSPIKGAKVHLTGTQGQTQLTSDAKGCFHSVLEPGTYSVTAELPTGYNYEDCGGSTVTIKEHRCARLVICAEPKSASPAAAE
jgi:hypothetical protein